MLFYLSLSALVALPLSLVATNGIEHFLAVDRDLLGCFDSKTDFITADFYNNDGYVVVDYNTLVFFAGQHKHGFSPVG